MGEGETNGRDGVLSPVSSADSRISKSSRDNRVFERLSVSSIQYFAESLGYDTHYRKFFTILSADALCALTEDVNYRLRELANNAALFMRQRRGEKLTVGDLNEALKWSGFSALLGHRSRDPPRLHFLKDVNIFAPNEGVVDATTMSLAKVNLPPLPSPILTGHHFAHVIDAAERIKTEVCDEIGQLNGPCQRLLQLSLSCKLKEFNEYLTAIGRVASTSSHCALIFLTYVKSMMKQSPSSSRVWYCLREIIMKSDLSRSAEGLNAVSHFAEMVRDSMLRPSTQDLLSPNIDLHCLLINIIAKKYPYLSSVCHLDQALFRKMVQIHSLAAPHSCLILRALLSVVDISVIFSHIDFVISQFHRYVENDSFGDMNQYFAWKQLICEILRICARCLPETSSAVDSVIWTLLPLAKEVFGDALVLAMVDRDLTDAALYEVMARAEKATNFKTGNEFLEEHWNTLTGKRAVNENENRDLEAKSKIGSSKRKKRPRESPDAFTSSKRLRQTRQHDIIFVFHDTQAIVRPARSPKCVPNDERRTGKSRLMDERINELYGRFSKHRRNTVRKVRPLLASPVDVCTIVV